MNSFYNFNLIYLKQFFKRRFCSTNNHKNINSFFILISAKRSDMRYGDMFYFIALSFFKNVSSITSLKVFITEDEIYFMFDLLDSNKFMSDFLPEWELRKINCTFLYDEEAFSVYESIYGCKFCSIVPFYGDLCHLLEIKEGCYIHFFTDPKGLFIPFEEFSEYCKLFSQGELRDCKVSNWDLTTKP